MLLADLAARRSFRGRADCPGDFSSLSGPRPADWPSTLSTVTSSTFMFGKRRGDEMADRLADGAIVAAVGADDDGGRRRLPLAAERAFVAHHDMDAGRLDAAHHLDRAREFALDRAHPRHLLHEGGEAERAELVVELVADAAAVRQALFRQRHARLARLADGHQHRGAVSADVEGDSRFAQAPRRCPTTSSRSSPE